MGYLKNFSRVYDKELAIKNKLDSIDKDKKDRILAICRRLRKRDINEFLHEADRMMKYLNEGRSFEDIEKFYGVDEMYELEKEEVSNGWRFNQVRLGKVVR